MTSFAGSVGVAMLLEDGETLSPLGRGGLVGDPMDRRLAYTEAIAELEQLPPSASWTEVQQRRIAARVLRYCAKLAGEVRHG